MDDKIKKVLDMVIEQFRTGDIPEAITLSMFPIPDLPSSRWSLLNRTIMFLSGTMDARGLRQWNRCNRYVKKGSRAIHILVPYIKTVEDDSEEKHVLTGFGLKPVFRMEDTEGEPLDYRKIELPDLPLMDRALEWGISVKAVPGNYRYYGYYNPSRKEIGLASPAEAVFFHELAHHADMLIKGKLKKGQRPLQEITAELAAASLCRLVGKQSDTLGSSYQYITEYAKKLNMSVYSVCLRVMADTEKILKLVLGIEEYRMGKAA